MRGRIDVERLCAKAKAASRLLALIDSRAKDKALAAMGDALVGDARRIVRENARDVSAAGTKGMSKAATQAA